MESREVNIMFCRSGSGSVSARIPLPKKWVDKMGITPEERLSVVAFDGDKIIIEKKEKKK